LKEQGLELSERCRSELGAPFLLNLSQNLVNSRVGIAAPFRQPDDSRATLARSVGPRQIAKSLETPQQLIHGLLADSRALREHAGANAIGSWKLEDRHVRDAQLLESGSIETIDDAPVNGLRRNPQQGAKKHVVRGRRGLACR
jgi:hypothetical protein